VLSSTYQSTDNPLLSTLYEPLSKHLISVLEGHYQQWSDLGYNKAEPCRDLRRPERSGDAMRMTGQDTSSTARYPEDTSHCEEGSRTRSAEGIDNRNAVAASARVGLSSRARDIQQAREVAQEAPEVRAEKVEAARRAVHRGSLTLQGQALAEKLLQDILRS
jgi:flagellar biosynthesis anti-sigma factor FlgM